jgi:hypothetical protein
VVIRGDDGGTKLCPQEANASPTSIAVNSLEGVVVGDTESRESRQADGKEKYVD